jgi:hypothetical protein
MSKAQRRTDGETASELGTSMCTGQSGLGLGRRSTQWSHFMNSLKATLLIPSRGIGRVEDFSERRLLYSSDASKD